MKKFFLAVPLLLAACAPAPTYAGPKPAPNEVIVESVSSTGSSNGLSQEQLAAVNSFAQISAMLIVQDRYDTGLPAGYERFTFPNGSESMQRLNDVNSPIHVRIAWRATNPTSKHTIDVQWESKPLTGKWMSVTAKASTTDPTVSTQQIEDKLLQRFVSSNGITLVAKGR